MIPGIVEALSSTHRFDFTRFKDGNWKFFYIYVPEVRWETSDTLLSSPILIKRILSSDPFLIVVSAVDST